MTLVTGTARIGGVDHQASTQLTLPPAGSPELDAFGIVTPWQIPEYDDPAAVMALVADLGVKTIRGRWRTGGKGDQVMGLCAEYGIGWLVTFIPEEWAESATTNVASTETQLASRMRAALSHPDAADVVVGVENANEPNHARSGGGVAADWPARCARWATVMHTIRAEVGGSWPILSPAMHDVADDNANGGHWLALAASGCRFNVISLHAYPKGKQATNLLTERLGRVNAAYPSRPPVWLTEFGWMTDPGTTGPAYTTPAQAATYIAEAPALLYGYGGQVQRSFYYELIGSDRGLWRNDTWTLPGVALRDLLT